MVKALVLERKRRSTAGSRMSSLVGQAAKDDETFWSHSTWSGEKGEESDDGSFHESDEESDAKVDTFDSDFDDSEGEEDQGEDAEAALLKEERQSKRAAGKKKMMDMVNAGRELMQKKKNAAQRKRAIRGNDVNAGIVLNMPGAAPILKPTRPASAPVQKKSPIKKEAQSNLPARRSSRTKSTKFSVSDAEGKRSLRTSTNTTTAASTPHTSRQQAQPSTKSKHKRKFTQEELLLEAISKTEGENQRWLLSRKRQQIEENSRAELNKKIGQQIGNKKVISKFNSRRGCLNTFTFPEMDHVPDIFTRGKFSEEHRSQKLERSRKENVCVITGQKARYRDPKTKLGYYNLAAFKELRKRLDAGESLDSLAKPKNNVIPMETVNNTVHSKPKKVPDTKVKAEREIVKLKESVPKVMKEVLVETKEGTTDTAVDGATDEASNKAIDKSSKTATNVKDICLKAENSTGKKSVQKVAADQTKSEATNQKAIKVENPTARAPVTMAKTSNNKVTNKTTNNKTGQMKAENPADKGPAKSLLKNSSKVPTKTKTAIKKPVQVNAENATDRPPVKRGKTTNNKTGQMKAENPADKGPAKSLLKNSSKVPTKTKAALKKPVQVNAENATDRPPVKRGKTANTVMYKGKNGNSIQKKAENVTDKPQISRDEVEVHDTSNSISKPYDLPRAVQTGSKPFPTQEAGAAERKPPMKSERNSDEHTDSKPSLSEKMAKVKNQQVPNNSKSKKRELEVVKRSAKKSKQSESKNMIGDEDLQKKKANTAAPDIPSSHARLPVLQNVKPTVDANLAALANSTMAHNMASNMVNMNIATPDPSAQSQLVRQTIANMQMGNTMNSISMQYQAYNNMMNANQCILSNGASMINISGNPGLLQYASANQQSPYQQVLAPPSMDVASMLAMSLNQNGMGMQPFFHARQQMQQHNNIPNINPLLQSARTSSTNNAPQNNLTNGGKRKQNKNLKPS